MRKLILVGVAILTIGVQAQPAEAATQARSMSSWCQVLAQQPAYRYETSGATVRVHLFG